MSRNAPQPAPGFFDELRKIPPVTRFVVCTTVVTTLGVMVQVLPINKIHFMLDLVKKMQVWRIPTSFFFAGGGLPFLFDTIMLYRNSNSLEETYYHNRSPEYAYQLLISCIGITLLNLPIQSVFHFRAMLTCITYLTSRLSPNAPVSIFGIVSVKALYFPFVLVGLDLIQGGIPAAATALTGAIAGHAWWMLEWRDEGNGGTGGGMGRAPGWLVNLVGGTTPPNPTQPASRSFGSASAPRGRGLNDKGSGASVPGETHSWGSGQRLGNN